MVKWSSRTDVQSDIKKNSPQLRKKNSSQNRDLVRVRSRNVRFQQIQMDVLFFGILLLIKNASIGNV